MNLNRFLKAIFLSFLAITIVAWQPCLSIEKDDINYHLAEYSQYNVTYHDNIDDEPHAHKHKHSKDGEEHEHHHKHTKVSQYEIKIINHPMEVLSEISVSESGQAFTMKNLISNPHPSKIYRPPIVI